MLLNPDCTGQISLDLGNVNHRKFLSLGLTLEVFLDQSNYMKNRLSKKAGGKIVVHDPNTPPLPNEYGLELRPNTASSIAVQVILYQSD